MPHVQDSYLLCLHNRGGDKVNKTERKEAVEITKNRDRGKKNQLMKDDEKEEMER